jgi:hypothetical protein
MNDYYMFMLLLNSTSHYRLEGRGVQLDEQHAEQHTKQRIEEYVEYYGFMT